MQHLTLISGQYTEKEIRNLSDKKLEKELKPVIDNVHIGAIEFHSVNIDLGDNAFINLFDLNT